MRGCIFFMHCLPPSLRQGALRHALFTFLCELVDAHSVKQYSVHMSSRESGQAMA